jgi:3-oxoadipate enol-lactonase
MATFRSGDTELYYELAGSGRPLMYLNGSGATLADAKRLVDQLAERFTVAAFDARGMGRSAPVTAPYGMAQLAADAVALADHLEWDGFRLFGISFGGMVAQELAVSQPERVKRLALACTSAGGAGGASFPLDGLRQLPADERGRRFASLIDTRWASPLEAGSAPGSALAKFIADRHTAEKPDAVRHAEQLQMRARAEHDVYARLARITAPTLVAAGRYDAIAPPANGAAIAERIPGALLRVFEGGHLCVLQDPRALTTIIDFLAGP